MKISGQVIYTASAWTRHHSFRSIWGHRLRRFPHGGMFVGSKPGSFTLDVCRSQTWKLHCLEAPIVPELGDDAGDPCLTGRLRCGLSQSEVGHPEDQGARVERRSVRVPRIMLWWS